MKITPKDYQYLKNAISKVYNSEQSKEKRKLGLSEVRIRWDYLWIAKEGTFVCNVLYKYLNDNHIDTALKNIVIELEK